MSDIYSPNNLQKTLLLLHQMEKSCAVRLGGGGSLVVRGADWGGGNADGLEGGSGRGAVVRGDGNKGVVAVKWENGNYGFYKMGAGGKYEVKIAPPVISQVMDNKLEETRSTASEEEYGTEDEDENGLKVNTRLLGTEQGCEVCGSRWTEKMREGKDILFRCIKHRKGRQEIQ